MKVTLDLYTKKTKAYYWGLGISLVTLSFSAIMGIFSSGDKPSPPGPKSQLEIIFDITLILGVFISLIFFVTAGIGTVVTYYKDGELVLDDDYLIIDNVKMKFDDISKINLTVAQRTIKSWRLVRNRIEITDKKGDSYNRRFAVSRDEGVEFEKVLDRWRATHAPFTMSYNRI